jgi:hypothetical protein
MIQAMGPGKTRPYTKRRLLALFLRTFVQSSRRDWKSEMAPFPALKRRAKVKCRSAAGKLNLKILDKAHFDSRTFISSLKTRNARRLYCLALFAKNENSARSNGLSVVSNS